MTGLIGISGKMGSGKTTLARILARRIPGARVMSFADALREEVAEKFGIPVDWTRERKNSPMPRHTWCPACEDWAPPPGATIREVLQEYGQRRRAEDPGYWVRQLRYTADDHLGVVIVDDTRYANELEWVKGLSGLTVRLEKHGWGYGPDLIGAGHASETELDNARFGVVCFAAYGGLEMAADAVLEAFPGLVSPKSPDIAGRK